MFKNERIQAGVDGIFSKADEKFEFEFNCGINLRIRLVTAFRMSCTFCCKVNLETIFSIISMLDIGIADNQGLHTETISIKSTSMANKEFFLTC